MNSVDISIIILSYNTKQLTLDAIASIEKSYPKEVAKGTYEVIVADNASTDGSLEAFNEYKKQSHIASLHVINNGGNIGFSAGNNRGVKHAHGTYILFLNADTILYPKTLPYLLECMKAQPNVGAVTCRLMNKDGAFDFNCHRGFPTPWNSFCYFSGLQRIFSKSRLFAGYTQGWQTINTKHEVDAIEGAFMLMPKSVGEKVGWWDEDYFFYGEDLQFCYDIKQLGYTILYIGEVSIMHIGGAASGIKKKTQNLTIANIAVKRQLQKARFDSMRIFYRKNYQKKYPIWIKWLLFSGIILLEKKTLKSLALQPREL
jgi:GT2 family glycosyltransferase